MWLWFKSAVQNNLIQNYKRYEDKVVTSVTSDTRQKNNKIYKTL